MIVITIFCSFRCLYQYLPYFQAVETLNIKPNFWKDLVTDEPFTRKDIITIQDPTNLDKFNLASFYHIRKNLKLVSEGISLYWFQGKFRCKTCLL